MSKKLLITFVVLALIAAGFIGSALVARNKFINPQSLSYNLKLAGEWLDVNFITFEASAKQAKHLEFSQRRLDEYLAYSSLLNSKQIESLNRSYEVELASAEFMAEQMAILNHKYIPQIEAVYVTTLKNIQSLWPGRVHQGEKKFLDSAEIYNGRSIKSLLQKHQHSPADTLRYKALVEQRLAAVELYKSTLTAEQLQTLNKAKIILAQGKEIEWAYDLLSTL